MASYRYWVWIAEDREWKRVSSSNLPMYQWVWSKFLTLAGYCVAKERIS